jgi:hypothetical protein
MLRGDAFGFARAIRKDGHFVGYLANVSQTQLGTGLYFDYNKLKYSGVFQELADYTTQAPQVQYEFSKFESYT